MIAKGKESVEGAGYKRYIGIAPCFVKAVNPTKAELELLLNTQLENEPEYIKVQDNDGEEVQTVRISFIVKPDPDKTGMDVSPITVSLWLRKQYRFNKDKSKVQVIDKYGRTAWVTQEELKTHAIPQYSNGPANLDPDYRPCYVGEEDLTNFLIAYLNTIRNTAAISINPQNVNTGFSVLSGKYLGLLDHMETHVYHKIQTVFKFALPSGTPARQEQQSQLVHILASIQSCLVSTWIGLRF